MKKLIIGLLTLVSFSVVAQVSNQYETVEAERRELLRLQARCSGFNEYLIIDESLEKGWKCGNQYEELEAKRRAFQKLQSRCSGPSEYLILDASIDKGWRCGNQQLELEAMRIRQ